MKPFVASVRSAARVVAAIQILAPVLALAGCNGNNRQPIHVQLMPNSVQTLEQGKALPVSATLSNDSGRKGVAWTLAGAGSLAAQTPTSVMYQAPANVTSETRVTVTATAIANSSKGASLTVVLMPLKSAR